MGNFLQAESTTVTPAQTQSWRMHHRWKVILSLNTVVCAVVALFLWLMDTTSGMQGMMANLLYSNLIGQPICISILILSYCQQRIPALDSNITLLVYPLIILFGYFAGSHTAALMLGHAVQSTSDASVFYLTMLITVSVTIGSLWIHRSREKIASLRLAAAEEAAQATSAKLSMLQAQIEPHMLFNTLSNIRSLVISDPPRAEQMLDQLVQFLRATLSGSQTVSSSLAVEFALLENYLNLMQTRLGDRLSFTLQLPENLKSIRLPALILQPLIENALKHGIEPTASGGHISVRAQLADSVVTVHVTDTGVGFKSIVNDETSGFGLRSVHERLVPIRNGLQSVSIESPLANRSSGTNVTIRLPLERVEQSFPLSEPEPST